MTEETIFTKIINGDIPCHKVYEDERTFAFMDINPVSEGHVLVVPKNPVEFVWDLPDEDYRALMASVKRIALRLREVIGKKYVGQKVEGVDVPHAHVHLIPFTDIGEFKHSPDQNGEPDHDKLAELAEKIRF